MPITSELVLDGATSRLKRPNGNCLDLLGRVRPGVNPKPLEAKLRVEFHDWLASHVADMEPRREAALAAADAASDAGRRRRGGDMRDQYKDGLKLLLIAAGCVLLVACGNLANLMLARGLKNRHADLGPRGAGCFAARLVRKALVESVLLAVIGGAFGIGGSVWRNAADSVSGLRDRRAEQLCSGRARRPRCRCCCLRWAFRF